MAEIALIHRPALTGVKAGRFGAIGAGGPGITIRALPEGRVLHVLGAAGVGDLEARLRASGLGEVRWIGPHQWLIVGDTPIDRSALAEATKRFGSDAAVSDQSHGRVRISVSGRDVAAVLAKGTAIDFGGDSFPIGRSCATLLGHVSVCLARIGEAKTGEATFELTVSRGFAESLWHDLVEMGLEYGVEAHPPA